MSTEVRVIEPAELPAWLRALRTGFLQPPVVDEEEVEARRGFYDPARTRGAFDAGRCVATLRSFAQELTVPGGARLPADAISNVAVLPTHRRRGLLGRMLTDDIAAARERGDAVATLVAAEYPIYGRYGFGPAAWTTEWRVDVTRSGLDRRRPGPEFGGRVELVDGAEVRKLGPGLHDRIRARRPGFVSRGEHVWRLATGDLRLPSWGPWTEPYFAVYRNAQGEPEGLLSYTADDRWEGKQPLSTARVDELLALTPAAERALWHFVLSVDWISAVETGHRAPDDVLPLLLPDPRAARVTTHADLLWIRLLDVPRALEARSYAAAGGLVLDVRDETAPGGGPAGGRFRLDASPDGASCTPTTAAPDLTLSAADLATLYLGDESAVRLATLGRADEGRDGAAALADQLLRTSRRPWCPDIF
ncbi:GNAT family N-acetyltransferase [Streptomyces zingiberis]|uniref:GNAT family N-acetyltransferase n=1 Tax=Streptomyces zingiberis TaxID=2053010 RepID=A0ABX1BQR6_9ACTN|nr:GNAT family N-acetyltransferase [Streptomyces zingiberis]NJQ00074.1 GNAT family N-acetyltransferase [Streptomyces zingiberis]